MYFYQSHSAPLLAQFLACGQSLPWILLHSTVYSEARNTMSASAINALLGAQTKDSVAWLLNACFRNRHDSSLVRVSSSRGRNAAVDVSRHCAAWQHIQTTSSQVPLETVKDSFSLEDDEAAKKVGPMTWKPSGHKSPALLSLRFTRSRPGYICRSSRLQQRSSHELYTIHLTLILRRL